MEELYANIIIDISHEAVDRAFQYRVPERLKRRIKAGSLVVIPFGNGNTMRKGYVVELTKDCSFDPARLKDIYDLDEKGMDVEGQLIELASWLKERWGSTMNQALKTVIPVKQKIKVPEKKEILLAGTREEEEDLLLACQRKNQKARVRLLSALLEAGTIPYEVAVEKLHMGGGTLKSMEEKGMIRIRRREILKNPIRGLSQEGVRHPLTQEQQEVCRGLKEELVGEKKPCLIRGITGSGKTEVYMELIETVLAQGKDAIVLIPEIALTYQTVMRFYRRFGDWVSIINSRMSQGERYAQFQRAKRKEIRIMIGPRSALFTPFPDLGLIVIDEEQETAYKSETAPRYHAREVALKRASMCGALAVFGSATPSVESYYRAMEGKYRLFTLKNRAVSGATLPKVSVVDLREELKEGNKSVFSRKLFEKIRERLDGGEQVMLFLNRRGYAGFITCRSCGAVIKCPHCDISLTAHQGGKMICHYCGYERELPRTCPSCGSPYIAGFRSGTEKIESLVKSYFPQARVLRMDGDTTGGKDGYEKILSAFANEEADILVGTQMIVKGHDFPKVTLMGILAADMSLYSEDYQAAERTFNLLTQAAGRAGRGGLSGEVVIQTYTPEHYAVAAAAAQDYEEFYSREILYRRLLSYPPCVHMMQIRYACEDASLAEEESEAQAKEYRSFQEQDELLQVVGPAWAGISRIKDIYYRVLYVKHPSLEKLLEYKRKTENHRITGSRKRQVMVQYDIT